MAFAPGQFITAQRLNRLQPKMYFTQCNAANSTVGSGNLAGTAVNITTETNGATAAFTYSAAIYATGAMAANANTFPKWDVNSGSTFALAQLTATGEKTVAANVWVTTIPTAGTYTFQLGYTVVTNSQIQVYSAMMVQILEVA